MADVSIAWIRQSAAPCRLRFLSPSTGRLLQSVFFISAQTNYSGTSQENLLNTNESAYSFRTKDYYYWNVFFGAFWKCLWKGNNTKLYINTELAACVLCVWTLHPERSNKRSRIEKKNFVSVKHPAKHTHTPTHTQYDGVSELSLLVVCLWDTSVIKSSSYSVTHMLFRSFFSFIHSLIRSFSYSFRHFLVQI